MRAGNLAKFGGMVVVSLLMLGVAAAMQPPDVVTSDSSANTAMGTGALIELGTGSDNTAAGWYALAADSSGSENTAFGVEPLYFNGTGSDNSAFGYFALYSNVGGSGNTASGSLALFYNTNGGQNTAVGSSALIENSTGNYNTGVGEDALYFGNGTGNTAIGFKALGSTTTGIYNVGVGYSSGYSITTGNNNIDILNAGSKSDTGIIRIGTPGSQSKTYIAGISGSLVPGSAVFVNSLGQLGVNLSSKRYKTAIEPMGDATRGLDRLRPVTFRYKADATRVRQYGLIAEEVAAVYPELVIRNERGAIQGLRYEELAPMLLNELQQQRRALDAEREQLAAQAAQLAKLQQQLADLGEPRRTLQVALREGQAYDGAGTHDSRSSR